MEKVYSYHSEDGGRRRLADSRKEFVPTERCGGCAWPRWLLRERAGVSPSTSRSRSDIGSDENGRR